MPIAAIGVGLGTAIAGGAAAGATIYGAHKSASANKDAARLEAESFDKAQAAAQEERDYGRQQFADYVSRVQGGPRMSTGAPLAQARMGGGQQQGQQPLLTFKAPNGQTQQRPASERYYWLSKGAQVVS